jgi:hypothetical protein
MDSIIQIKLILLNDKIIFVTVPVYYIINDIINDLINIYDLDTYGSVYSLYTTEININSCIFYDNEEIYLNPELYINDLELNENELTLILKKESIIIFNIKKLIRNLKFLFNWI